MGGIGSGRYQSPSRARTVEECDVLAVATRKGRTRFTLIAAGEPPAEVDCPAHLRLCATFPHFGGRRWWFACAASRNGEPCGRHVLRLYRLPEGESDAWACRRCHGLQYRSAQENHRHTGLAALVAREVPPVTSDFVRRLLSGARRSG